MKPILLFGLTTVLLCASAQDRPNVLFVMADDIGIGDFSCYGAKLISTPTIDKFAADNVQFMNAYSACSISNPTSIDRVGEMVEVEIDNADEYAIFTTEGKALPCQVTYDGKLIFQTDVNANSTEHYLMRKAPRIDIDTIATGKVYPVWLDDFAWENDKIAFRTYSKKMAAQDANLFGYDIFTKRHKYPVLDALYGVAYDKEYLKRRKKFPVLGDIITYHVDHGFGMDYYVVGPTLGCGTAALVEDGEICYPGLYDTVEVLDKGGLRITFRLTYAAKEIAGDMVQEVRTISLDKGTHFNHIDVEYRNLTKPTDLVIGLVLHDSGEANRSGDGFIAYAEPVHQYGWQTYNAVIYPDEKENTIAYFYKTKGPAEGHILSKGLYTPGEKLSYYMGAGWNRWGFETPEDWFDFVELQREIVTNPLVVAIE